MSSVYDRLCLRLEDHQQDLWKSHQELLAKYSVLVERTRHEMTSDEQFGHDDVLANANHMAGVINGSVDPTAINDRFSPALPLTDDERAQEAAIERHQEEQAEALDQFTEGLIESQNCGDTEAF